LLIYCNHALYFSQKPNKTTQPIQPQQTQTPGKNQPHQTQNFSHKPNTNTGNSENHHSFVSPLKESQQTQRITIPSLSRRRPSFRHSFPAEPPLFARQPIHSKPKPIFPMLCFFHRNRVSVKKTQQTHALFLLLFNRKDMLSIPFHLFIFLSFSSIASLPVEPDPPDVPFLNLLPLALLLLLLCFPVNAFLLCWWVDDMCFPYFMCFLCFLGVMCVRWWWCTVMLCALMMHSNEKGIGLGRNLRPWNAICALMMMMMHSNERRNWFG